MNRIVVNETVQVVLVGCGAVSQFLHAPALLTLERAGMVRVSGLVDPLSHPRDELRESFPNASPYPDLTSCPLGPDTLVIVASPPRWHAEQSVFALSKGAAVLCEKPMAASSAEAELMLKAAAESGTVLAVGLYRRFLPAAEAVKEFVEKGPLGSLIDFKIQEGGKFAWGAASDSYFQREQTPGGVSYDIGVHVFDLLLWWLGNPDSFTYQDDAMGGIEANSRLDLSYPHGVRGSVRLSRDWDTQNRYLFTFEKGVVAYGTHQANRLELLIDGIPFVIGGELATPSTRHSNGLAKYPARTNSQSFIEQLRNVIAAVRGQEPLRVPGTEGIRSLRFLEDCYRSRTLIEMPWLTNEERRTAEHLAKTSL